MNKNKSRRNDHIIEKSKKHKDSSKGNKFSVIEAYKALRTNLQFSLNNHTSNVIMITSAMPYDGKSTVVTNLGVAFSQSSTRVLIIDCDMRKPRINKFFGVSATPGLSNYLAGLSPMDDVILKTSYPNVSVITSGVIPPNPAELLSSSTMQLLIDELRNKFDLIILDTPPVNLLSDAHVVTKYVDGVILVAKHATTTYADMEKAIKGLEFVNAKILGFVLNSVKYDRFYNRSRYYKNYSRYGKYSNYGNYGNYGKSHGNDDSVILDNKQV